MYSFKIFIMFCRKQFRLLIIIEPKIGFMNNIILTNIRRSLRILLSSSMFREIIRTAYATLENQFCTELRHFQHIQSEWLLDNQVYHRMISQWSSEKFYDGHSLHQFTVEFIQLLASSILWVASDDEADIQIDFLVVLIGKWFIMEEF